MSKRKPPIEVVGKPRLLRSGAPTAPVCKAMITFIDFKDDGTQREWKTRCNRAFADKQEVCKCGAKRPKSTDEDHGYTQSSARSLRGSGEEVPADEQKTFATIALEHRQDEELEAWTLSKRRILAETRELRRRTQAPRVLSELRAIEKRIGSLDRKLTA